MRYERTLLPSSQGECRIKTRFLEIWGPFILLLVTGVTFKKAEKFHNQQRNINGIGIE